MRKDAYIQLVKDATGNQFKDRTIAVQIGMALEQLWGQVWAKDPNQLDQYTKDFTVPVTGNYVKFPKRIVQFKDLKKGCRSISTTDGTTVQFVPVSLLGRKIYPSINTGDTSIGFEVKTDRAIFDNLPDEIKEVVVSLVIPFDQFEMTDDIPAPSGVNELIVQFAVDSLLGKGVPLSIFKTPTHYTQQ